MDSPDSLSGPICGVDAGGSKCAALLLDAEGRPDGWGRAGPANPNGVGVEASIEAILAACRDALRGRKLEELCALGIGVAGAGSSEVREALAFALARAVPGLRFWIGTDLQVALEGAFEGDPGVVIVSGTGSAALARGPSGEEVRCGGWGARLGDEGSGYWFVHQCVRGLMKMLENREEPQGLERALIRDLGALSFGDLPAAFHRASERPFEVAMHAFVLLRDFPDHPVVIETIDQAGLALTELCRRASRAAGMEEPRIATFGGLLDPGSPVLKSFERYLASRFSTAWLVPADHPPEWGAAHAAKKMLVE